MTPLTWRSVAVVLATTGAGLHRGSSKQKKVAFCLIMALKLCLYGRQGMFVEQLNSS
jgi:hypothetical protein